MVSDWCGRCSLYCTHTSCLHISGFDEYMNIVLDEAEELHMKTLDRKKLGRILLKGDNITLIQTVQ